MEKEMSSEATTWEKATLVAVIIAILVSSGSVYYATTITGEVSKNTDTLTVLTGSVGDLTSSVTALAESVTALKTATEEDLAAITDDLAAIEERLTALEEAVEITVLRFQGWSAGPVESEKYRKMFMEFMLLNPFIRVKYETYAGETKILADIAAGTAPDVFYVGSEWAPRFMSEGVLLPLDGYLTAEHTDDFVPALLDAFTWEGTVYGLPKDFSVLGLAYNKEIFTAAGLDPDSPPTTWAELASYANTIYDQTGIPGLVQGTDIPRWLPFVYQNGGQFLSEDYTECLTTDPNTVASLEWWAGRYLDGTWVSPADVGAGWVGDAYGLELAAMAITGNWAIPYIKEDFPDVWDKTGWAVMPMGTEEATMAFTVSLAIWEGTENPEAAWKLIDFMTSYDGQKELVIDWGHALPSRISLADHPNMWPEHATFMEQYAYSHAFIFGVEGFDIMSLTNTELSAALAGVKTAAEACADMKTEIDAILAG